MMNNATDSQKDSQERLETHSMKLITQSDVKSCGKSLQKTDEDYISNS